jgi:hypothetical protein
MLGMKSLRLAVLVGLATVCVGGRVASANSITYTEQAVVSGTIGGAGFSGADITIQWTGDTSNVVDGGFGFFSNQAGANTVSVTISGLGSSSFTDDVYVFSNQGALTAGFGSNTTGGTSILDTVDPVFASYDLTTAIGPIANTPFFRSDEFYGTGLGLLNISAVRENSTFTATTDTAPVPEPASLTLLGLGLAGMAGRRWRQRKA